MNVSSPQLKTTKLGAPRAISEMADRGTTQARATFEKINAASAETTDLIKNSYSTAVNGAQDCSKKVLEFMQTNTNAAFDVAQKLSGVKSPSEFLELSAEFARKQFETLTEQTKELASLAQKATLATTEPLKTGITKAFSHAA